MYLFESNKANECERKLFQIKRTSQTNQNTIFVLAQRCFAFFTRFGMDEEEKNTSKMNTNLISFLSFHTTHFNKIIKNKSFQRINLNKLLRFHFVYSIPSPLQMIMNPLQHFSIMLIVGIVICSGWFLCCSI